ncbi:SDR family NAD(P)-dependent oxidoreductase [Solimonas sp. K1W22B-7]|uniref:SDR family NAD(P)-dependent oxidoreductase n=1 Tax=Solimonas sp. K1W22B-7 TaxID=2303331 RepID=UPI000E330FFE|nr:SDR family NAD(P)-dependent oxidoreductase [Solimonas sp. K1W22B-7]AXQ30096.1 SDR family NAD(P)-dependent oxidoreductase [Solimonas sp. K1W22B-7]
MKLSEKTILITGASAGIGRCVAEKLAAGNNNVVITARRAAQLEDVASIVRARGSRCLVLPADALDEAATQAVVDRAVNEFGRMDAVLLNIGEGPAYNMATASAATIKRCMHINYDVTVNYLVPTIACMKAAGGGLIAHTNSLAGLLGVPMQGPYSAAKSACRLLLDTSRTELKRFNIRIASVYPGFIATERTADDGIPAPFEISPDACAEHILRAMERETPDTLFPWQTSLMTRVLQNLPKSWAGNLMLKAAAAEY